MARQFNGNIANYLNTELHAARGSTSNLTIVFALKLTAQAAAVSVLGTVDGGGDGFGFRVNQSGADTILQLHNNASGRSPSAVTILDKVKFIAVVNDVSANECRFYMGATAASMVQLPLAGQTALSFVGTAMPDMVIGARNNNGTIQEPLTGILDQLSIFFDTVLTLDEIKATAACGSSFAGSSTRYYQLDGLSPENDTSPANDPAVIVGTVPNVDEICSAGGPGSVRHFDGNDDYLETPSSSDSYAGMSIGMWVKRDGTGTKNGLIGRMWDAGNGWALYIDAANLLTWFSYSGAGDLTDVTIASPDLSDWTYIAMTYSSAGGVLRWYAGTSADNIVEIGSGAKTGTWGELGVSGIRVGAVNNGGVRSILSWNGYLDHVHVWYSARTLAELKAAAVCGAVVLPSDSKLIAPIIGETPEPCLFDTGALSSLTVFEATVSTEAGCGAGGSGISANEGHLLICI